MMRPTFSIAVTALPLIGAGSHDVAAQRPFNERDLGKDKVGNQQLPMLPDDESTIVAAGLLTVVPLIIAAPG